MINMGELFGHSKIGDIDMERVPLSDKEAENYLLEPFDLLFARQSLVASGAGQCSIFLGAAEPVTWEGHIIRARLDPDIASPVFYYYLFSSQLGKNIIGTIVEQVAAAGIRGSDLIELEVPYLPLAEQRAIAHMLGSLDDKIEANRRQNETLEATARAIFKSWFVDFDPVHAKARGEHPPGMDAATAALFPDSFEESELGPIPRGWGVLPLDHIADYLNGLAMQKYPADGADYLPVIKIRELRQGFTDDKSGQASTEIDSKYIVEDGDVIFSWSGSLLVDIWTGGIGGLNQHLFKVTSDDFPHWFYYFWTKYDSAEQT